MQISKKKNSMDVNQYLTTSAHIVILTYMVVIHTILWKFANLRLTSPSSPIRYTHHLNVAVTLQQSCCRHCRNNCGFVTVYAPSSVCRQCARFKSSLIQKVGSHDTVGLTVDTEVSLSATALQYN